MRICGIVAEYNPFHRGHAHHLQETRRLLGQDTALVCCMSGSFVQRGEPALLSKWARAQSAVQGGADLVIELPAPWSLSSAEGFAQGAVGLLDALGCLTDLSFGSELEEVETLWNLAQLLQEHRLVADTLHQLRSGISYAAARERALYQQVQQQAQLLRKPNIILGVEYCKALQRLGSAMEPHAILRTGAGHDEAGELLPGGQGICSASALRQRLVEPQPGQWQGYLPPESWDVFMQELEAGRAPANIAKGAGAMMAQLWRLSPGDLARLPGAAEGLEHRLQEAIAKAQTPQQVWEGAKTKRYALARLRRMVFCAFLGITAQEAAQSPAYLRVLAFSEKGRQVLATARKTAILPLITKAAHAKQLPPAARESFEKEVLRTRLHGLFCPDSGAFAPQEEWVKSPYFI